jgi:hypothetical protein
LSTAIEARRLRWEGDQLGSIVYARLPILSTVFRPQSATVFAGFHLGVAKPLTLSFQVIAEGVVKGLVFHSGVGADAKAEKLTDGSI